jgi:endoglucanase
MKTFYPNIFRHGIFTVWLCLMASAGIYAQTPVQRNGQLSVCGTKLCNQYGNAVQLRGMSTHGIQWYYHCLTDASLDALAYNWGADILRISLYVQEGGYETDPVGYTAKVTNLINEATERGMYALVDWHQLDPGDPNENLQNAKRFFTDIANAHKNKNNIIYDICNEPNYVPWSSIKTYADQIIPVIRAIDADAPIFIGTHAWASLGISDGRTAQDIVNLPVNFPNIMYTFHFYAATHGDRYLQELDWASDRLPIFVTEFGTQTASGDGTNNFTMAQRYIDLMRTKKIGWTNWNFSDDFRSGAVWNTGTCSGGPWTTAQLKPAGAWVRERILNPADDFPGGGRTIAPTVSITSPSNGASYTAPASIAINANAADSDGTITQVTFYYNGTPIGTDTSSPYTITWSGAAVGTYAITARATDNAGATGTSAAITVAVSGSSDNCAAVAPYVENGNYVAGSMVKNAGNRYECKPFPYSGWCNGAAWAYAPGTGTYWQDAWILKGACTTGARIAASDVYTWDEGNELVIHPNPQTPGERYINFTFKSVPEALTIQMKDAQGSDVFSTTIDDMADRTVRVAIPSLARGLYILKVQSGKTMWVQKYIIP